jgi:hypothetical protein
MLEREGPRWISRAKGGGGDGFIAGQSFQRKGRAGGSTEQRIEQEHIMFDRSEFRDLQKEFCPKTEKEAHQSKKERGRGRTGYAPDVFEVTILGSRLFRSKGSLNLAKLCFFSLEVSTFESPFDQKIGI